jgi:hypothetical protein
LCGFSACIKRSISREDLVPIDVVVELAHDRKVGV